MRCCRHQQCMPASRNWKLLMQLAHSRKKPPDPGPAITAPISVSSRGITSVVASKSRTGIRWQPSNKYGAGLRECEGTPNHAFKKKHNLWRENQGSWEAVNARARTRGKRVMGVGCGEGTGAARDGESERTTQTVTRWVPMVSHCDP